MEIPILNGVYVDADPRFRTLYPVNLAPVPVQTGISNSYLKPAEGMVAEAVGLGVDRGGINYDGICYRASGSKLITVGADNVVTVLGDIGGSTFDQHVRFDYSFDQLAIASNGNLFYWDGATLTQVTDVDLGTVVDMVWVDGYFMTTDGEFLVVTELNDPTQVNPLKYGASEIDPDPVVALLKLRNEVHALNRYTIEVFDNVGGDLFPFQRIPGAQIAKGCVGVKACCVFMEALAFVGSGRNEAPGVYLAASAQTVKISSQEIDTLLLDYTEAQLSVSLVETRNDKAHEYLYIHLPDRTIVYDATASQALQAPVWFTLTSSLTGFSQYRARSFVWAYNKWLVADPQSTALGTFSDTNGAHWGTDVRWEFGTAIIYNTGMGAVFHDLELVALTGRLVADTTISTSWSYDGVSYTAAAPIATGGPGNFQKRLCWRRQGKMRNWRLQRFQGDTRAHLSFARLEARVEPLMF
jgi:hypothetical protein